MPRTLQLEIHGDNWPAAGKQCNAMAICSVSVIMVKAYPRLKSLDLKVFESIPSGFWQRWFLPDIVILLLMISEEIPMSVNLVTLRPSSYSYIL